MSRVSTFPRRPPSEHLCDLHVYKVPLDLWRAPFNNILNQSVTETVSLGIIRVPPDLPLCEIRTEIEKQLEELAPKEYVFLRSVGRSITRVKSRQEFEWKAKHFLPPVHYAPELYILEATPELRDALAISDRSSQLSPISMHHGSPGTRSYRDGYRYTRQGYPDQGSSPRSPSPHRKGAGSKTYRGTNGYEREAAYTDNTNEDSGVAGLSPDNQYKNRDRDNYFRAANSKSRDHNRHKQEEDEEKRRRQEQEDRDYWNDQDERRRRAEEDRLRREEDRQREEAKRRTEEEGERRRREEEERRREEEERGQEEELRRREEEERRRREEEERRRREEEERRRQEEEDRLKGGSDEELDRFQSPPPLRMSSAEMDGDRNTSSAQQQRKEEQRKLLEELQEARENRHRSEREREELVKKAKTLQSKTQNRRNLARDIWKKRYFEEKKKTGPMEDQTNRLREELDALHRKLMAVLEGPREKNLKVADKSPSQRNNYVIQCTRLQHDIDDIKRRVENAKMKLTAEMKLRNQAEAELRAVRAEAVQKKINMRGQAFQVY